MTKNVMLGILIWNHWEIAARCLKSIRKHTDMKRVKFMLINNGSDDLATVKWFKSVEGKVDILDMDRNYGLAGGRRVAFEEAFADDDIEYVCFCDCDVLMTDEWLKRLVDIMELDQTLIAVTPKDNNSYLRYQNFDIPEEHQPETIEVGLFGDDANLQKYVKDEFYAKRKHPSHVIADLIDPPVTLWRKSAVIACGGLAEEFDYSHGMLELFMRSREKGYKIAYCLSSFVYHWGHGAAGKYEGYDKMSGASFNDLAAEKVAAIIARYGVSVDTYAAAGDKARSNWVRHEAEIVQL